MGIYLITLVSIAYILLINRSTKENKNNLEKIKTEYWENINTMKSLYKKQGICEMYLKRFSKMETENRKEEPLKDNLLDYVTEFKTYLILLFIGFIGGISAWIFGFTFEDLSSQIENFWMLLLVAMAVSVVWFFIFALFSFLILKIFKVRIFEAVR